MMKRLLAVLLFAATALSFAATAHAIVSYRSGGQLVWRHHQAAPTSSPNTFYGVSANLPADSSYVDSTGFWNPNTASAQDTSTVFKLPTDFQMPALTDSLPPVYIVFRSVPTQALSSGVLTRTAAVTFASGDTVYAIIEPAFAGNPPVASGAGLLTGVPKAAITAFAGATQVGVLKIFPQVTGTTTGSQTATVAYPVCTALIPAFGISPEFRVRIWSDVSGSTANAFCTAEVWYATQNIPDKR